ncbi:hypothetical protein GU926_08315 [Nibribacter ruber]|uniref:Uncharacterized protein n=1 Tax=Nibribacter ruber TaxID=2698458 RepID=A0A6P1NWL3_9BACT|nr:hypothetical protein [Nibribacter ruber]QHL87440.1 hypothetical protein GU926_08315 [Nibribacter ruber]
MITQNRRIETKTALLNWHKLVQRLNAAQPTIERKRLVKGEEVTYYTKKKLIPGNLEATGVRLILDYAAAYHKAIKVPVVAMAITEEGTLPSLSMNCVTLASRRTLSDRAIRSHLNVLKSAEVGLVTGYKFHGTYANFELWISPEILWNAHETAPPTAEEPPAETTHIAHPARFIKNNLPLNVSCRTQDTLKDKISSVDKGEAMPQPGLLREAAGNTCDTTGNIGPQLAPVSGEKATDSPVAGQAACVATTGGAAAPKKALAPRFEEMIIQFWVYAHKMLYPESTFSPEQHKMAKNAIYTGIYRGFKNAQMTAKDWETYHEELMERIDIAAAYFRKNPDKYPPAPFPLFGLGSGYFDFENERGFKKTHEWLVNRDVWKLQYQVENALRQARTEWTQYKKGKAPKRLQAKSPLELFRFHEAKIKPLGKDALNRFYAQHAIPQNQNV